MGLVSKKILDSINAEVRKSTQLNQWKSTSSVIEWFKGIPNKSDCTFTVFDIESFYPSISEELLKKSIEYAKLRTKITDEDIDIIMHSRKSLLFDEENMWIKKNNKLFDVTMGSYDGAEVCELVGLYILDRLKEICKKQDVGLYRDDGLAVFCKKSGPQLERIKKSINKTFNKLGLKITIKTNLKIVNYLDLTLNLKNGSYSPYRKPNDQPLYVNAKSNHPPTIIKHLPAAINKRLNKISSSKEIFEPAKPMYQQALRSSGHHDQLSYDEPEPRRDKKRNRKRNIIWFNPPFSKNLETNVGKIFLRLVRKHFPANHKLHKIVNKNTIKVSYSCMSNMKTLIKKHNNKILCNSIAIPKNDRCNCRNRNNCPLENRCQTQSVIYNAHVSSANNRNGTNYVGLTEGPFKKRYHAHETSFKDRRYEKSTELSKHIWKLNDRNEKHEIKWSIIARAQAYSNESKKCNLCLTEKLKIAKASTAGLLKKRSEMVSKCRHENKFYISNFKDIT
eukprot:gene7635-biopygen6221